MTSHQIKFYGVHTEKKLQAIQAYLERFLTIMSKQNFDTVYIDAFAGTGTIPAETGGPLLVDTIDAQKFVEGSALRAMRLERKFDQYIFIDKSGRKLDELQQLLSAIDVGRSRTQFIKGSAGVELPKLCQYLRKPNVRSVVFLDPFGSQVGWNTLTELAATEHVDLWYLFPSGMSVNRQISSSGKCTAEQAESLDFLFGPHDWRSKLIRTETTMDLFGLHETKEKSATVDYITKFMIECMREIFKGDVSKYWLPLGRDGAQWYSLIFAMANPSRKATKIGLEVAKHILTRM